MRSGDDGGVRLALISDIHGNTVALDAVLADMGDVELVVCLGDIAAGGPDPAGAIDRVAEMAAVSVQGNTDAGLVDMPAWWRDPRSIGLPAAVVPGMETCVWAETVLSDEQGAYLDGLPLTAEIDVGVERMLAFHGSPSSYDDLISASTPDDELDAKLGGASQQWLAGGHSHVPLLRRHRRQTLLNPGSVGMPFAEYGFAGGVDVLRHAAYAVLTIVDSGTDVAVDFRQVDVDAAALARSVERSGMPNGDWWLGLRR